ncbi:conjugal transfer protein TraL [Vibrio fluvialis]|uniref:conjugal transfer protein TraL n=1 Tax=Vibrio fluvialis TaxID=676 RepID=UPI0039996A8C
MKYIVPTIALIVFISTSLYAPESQANDDECAIWLCLPTGFPSGCGDAKKAFKKRIKKGKSPLPSLSSCMANNPLSSSNDNNNDVTTNEGIAALIPEHEKCAEWRYSRGKRDNDKVCVKQEIVPTQAIKGTRCKVFGVKNDTPQHTPKGCSTTIRFVDTFIDGRQYGKTFYFDSAGNEVHIP